MKQEVAMELLEKTLQNPVLTGLLALELNHAIYKSGWYAAESSVVSPAPGIMGWLGFPVTIPQEQTAVRMHESIAEFIMAASLLYAIAPAAGAAAGAAIKLIPQVVK